MKERTLPISSIKVGKRIRKEMGNLQALADSIRERTMLHPIVITPDNKLIAGRRRLEAAKLLGLKDVPVRVVQSLSGAADLLRAEGEENACREPFTPAEAEEYQRRLMELERPAARERQKEAGERGKEGGRGKKKENPSPNLGEGNGDHAGETARRAAAPTGYSASTLAKVAEIREAAAANPDLCGDLYEQTQQSGARIDPIHRELKKRISPPAAPARYSHSDLFFDWLETIRRKTDGIRLQFGGLSQVMRRDGWDASKNYLFLSMLVGLRDTIGTYIKELQDDQT